MKYITVINSDKFFDKDFLFNRVNKDNLLFPFYKLKQVLLEIDVFIHTSDILHKKEADIIILAGFLWKVPEHIVSAFPNRILNIHPALLPKYGGKGMYGAYVFEAIVANKEQETGITIHYVNEHYDEGAIIFQAKTALAPTDTVVEVAQKTHLLEHTHFALQIHQLLQNQ